MAEQSLVLPKPKTVLKMVFTGNQNMEVKTDRYTMEEIEAIFQCSSNTLEPIRFWGADENDHPVLVVIARPYELIGYLVLDFDSYIKTIQRAQFNAQQRGPLVRS